MSPEGSSPPPSPRDAQPGRPRPDQRIPRWAMWAVLGTMLAFLALAPSFGGTPGRKITYSAFLDKVKADQVKSVEIDNQSNDVTIVDKGGLKFRADGPKAIPDSDYALFTAHDVHYDFRTSQPNFFL